MPPKRRIPKAKTQPVSDTVWCLMHDRQPPPDANPFEVLNLQFPLTDFNQRLWEAYGERVLAEYVPANPGRRPSWWWLYEAPEPFRRRLNGSVESQAAYLQRHKLLTPAERRHLKQHPELLEAEAVDDHE